MSEFTCSNGHTGGASQMFKQGKCVLCGMPVFQMDGFPEKPKYDKMPSFEISETEAMLDDMWEQEKLRRSER